MRGLRELWRRWFLDERPSVSLALFRIAVALTVGCHMIPSFFHMADNYLPTAFKETNPSFFPMWALRLVERSPSSVVWGFVWLFGVSWLSFLVGFHAQASCALLTLACYYFYALNSLHIGTLSFDILLVTLSLMWVTGYHGDWFSIDSVRRGRSIDEQPNRPFFVQRLLQLQIAWTFWYTALSKMSAHGNWLTDKPYYYLMRYPAIGVVREFPFRHVLAQHPALCHTIGLCVIAFELSLPVLLFFARTRVVGLVMGFAFQLMLLITLHVPTIFFLLFPPQMLLFVPPERIVEWIRARRAAWAARGRARLLYDGRCGFCVESVRKLRALDVFGSVEPIDFRGIEDVSALHPSLTAQRCRSRMQLIEPGGRLTEGFAAIRRLSLRLPMLWPVAPIVWLPGVGALGGRVYDWIATRRFLIHRNSACATNQCALATGDSDSSNA